MKEFRTAGLETVLLILIFSLSAFLTSYLYINLEDFKHMTNYNQFCQDKGYIYINLNGDRYD